MTGESVPTPRPIDKQLTSPPPLPGQNASAADDILKLKSLNDQGIISPDEFETKKQQLLGTSSSAQATTTPATVKPATPPQSTAIGCWIVAIALAFFMVFAVGNCDISEADRERIYRQAREYENQDGQERLQQDLWELHQDIKNER